MGIAVTIVSIVGVSGITAAFRFSRSWGRLYRFLRLHPTDPLDMVLPTSQRATGGMGIKYMRSVTAVGNLRGATVIAQAIGKISRSRSVFVAVSEELETPLSGDLVVIGLPGKNSASRLVIGEMQTRYPGIGLEIREESGDCRLVLVGHTESYKLETQDAPSKIPTRDVALIALWVNPFALEKRRLVFAAGFTAYGTAAAASYLIEDIIRYRYRALRKSSGGVLPRLASLRRWPCFAMMVEVKLVNAQAVEVNELAFAPLRDPGRPPWRATPSAE